MMKYCLIAPRQEHFQHNSYAWYPFNELLSFDVMFSSESYDYYYVLMSDGENITGKMLVKEFKEKYGVLR